MQKCDCQVENELQIKATDISKISDEIGHKPWFKSKKWWMTVLALIVPVLNSRFGWELQVEELVAIILPIIAYVVVEGWTDSSHAQKQEKE